MAGGGVVWVGGYTYVGLSQMKMKKAGKDRGRQVVFVQLPYYSVINL